MSERFGFGRALEHMQGGHRVARDGWNGRGMFAYLVPAASYPVQTGAAKAHFGEGSLVPYRAYFALKTQTDDVATWTPSNSDILATDWFCLDTDDKASATRLQVTICGDDLVIDVLSGEPKAALLTGIRHAVERAANPDAPTAPGFHRYRSHKVVEAAEFVCIDAQEVFIKGPDGHAQALHGLPDDIFARGVPSCDDLIVRYNAGTPKEYLSWSPRDVFLDGYTRISED